MEKFEQPKIAGYRQLKAEDAALMNEAKAIAEQCGAFIARLRETGSVVDDRLVSIGAVQVAAGLTFLQRGVLHDVPFDLVPWAAGLFEGEGCFDHSPSGGNAHRPRAVMCLTDEDVLSKFRQVVGVGTIGDKIRPRESHYKPTWQWWTDEGGFHVVYALLRPWLGPRRRAAAESAISARASHIEQSMKPRMCVCCGEIFSPPAFTKGCRKQNRCAKRSCQLFRQSAPRKQDVIRGIAQPSTF